MGLWFKANILKYTLRMRELLQRELKCAVFPGSPLHMYNIYDFIDKNVVWTTWVFFCSEKLLAIKLPTFQINAVTSKSVHFCKRYIGLKVLFLGIHSNATSPTKINGFWYF